MVLVKNDNPESQLLKSEDGKPSTFERKIVEYADYSSRFREKKPDFSKQFAHMYACRLAELRPILIDKATSKWGKNPQNSIFPIKIKEMYSKAEKKWKKKQNYSQLTFRS